MRHPIPYMHPTRTGWDYRPPWIKECEAPKPQTMPEPRVETSEKAIARLRKLKDEHAERWIGRRAGDFYLASTDGHRALLLPWKPDMAEGKELPPDMSKLPHNCVKLSEGFYTVLQRAIAVHTEAPWAIELAINKGSVTVKAEAADDDTYQETVDTFSVLLASYPTIGFNAKYLLHALGVWPLYLHFTNAEHMVVLRPEDDSWRYLLMPLKL